MIKDYYSFLCYSDEEYKIYKKRENEKKTILCMIEIYCKNNHKQYHKSYNKTFGSKNICKECENIYNYASIRTDKCRFMETKTFCSACKSQCYNKYMKEKVKNIMRFSGKRMLFYNPIIALKHVIVMMKHNFNKKINFKGII